MAKKVLPPQGGCSRDCDECKHCIWKILTIMFYVACALKIGGPSVVDIIAKIVK